MQQGKQSSEILVPLLAQLAGEGFRNQWFSQYRPGPAILASLGAGRNAGVRGLWSLFRQVPGACSGREPLVKATEISWSGRETLTRCRSRNLFNIFPAGVGTIPEYDATAATC